MLLAAHVAAVVAARMEVAALPPRRKAALVVVSGLPAPAGVGGVIVRSPAQARARPRGALVFADQEGGRVRALPDAPPFETAAAYRSAAEARAAGEATGRGLRAAGVDVDLAPVLDLRDGPLGSREFADPAFGAAFARGLAAGGAGACAKHFPGLGSTPISTDDSPHVHGRLRARDLAPFRAAIRAGVPCVMVNHAFYRRFGERYRASLQPGAYRLLRSLGFRGVAITDSLSFVSSAPVERWAPQAVRAGADLLLFTSPAQAARAIRALVPLARRGELDAHVRRVLAFRSRFR